MTGDDNGVECKEYDGSVTGCLRSFYCSGIYKYGKTSDAINCCSGMKPHFKNENRVVKKPLQFNPK